MMLQGIQTGSASLCLPSNSRILSRKSRRRVNFIVKFLKHQFLIQKLKANKIDRMVQEESSNSSRIAFFHKSTSILGKVIQNTSLSMRMSDTF